MITRRFSFSSSLFLVALFSSGCVLDGKVGSNSAADNGAGGSAGAPTGGSGGFSASGGSSASGGASSGGTSAGGSAGSGTGGAATCAFESPFLSPPTVLATGQVNPEALAVDGTSVYWVNRSIDFTNGGSVMKVSTAGGQPETLASVAMYPSLPDQAFDDVVGLAVSATHAYWRAAQGRQVWRVPIAGGAPEQIYDGGSAQDNSDFLTGSNGVHNIAVDGAHVYWTRFKTFTDQVLYVAPIAGGSASEVPGSATSVVLTGVATNANGVYWATYGSYPMGFMDGSVMAADPGGANAHGIATSFGNTEMLAADATNLYATGWELGRARRLDPTGSSAPVELNPHAAASRSIAVDDTNAYVSVDYAENCHGILRMPKTPGNSLPIPLRMGADFHPFTIALDAQNIYWIDDVKTEIAKMAK